ncbi:Vitellogenin-1 [Oryzias melastigma]|uniref:Vitellogenin-1 n=1 Tax=Oryzias melastigma TaxID=30732 RepID=A0A834BNS2_ORYME|nr:Vitellogenin-1 [Oryzias melastigma]
MKAVVLALTLALVAPDFSPGKTYVYKYEASIMNGLPDEGLARAGLNITSKFLINAVNQNTYMLKPLELKINEYNGVWPKDHPEPGVCKTLYSVNEDVKADRILLTKTKDMNHCQERITRDMGLAYTEKCEKCQRESKNLRGSTSYRYVLKPVPSGIMILEADVNELIQFSPVSERYGAVQTETRQTLSFLEIEKSPIAPIPAEYHHRGSLKYEFSNEFDLSPFQLAKVTDERAQIEELLNHLITHNAEEVNEHAPLKYWELIQFLRLARYEDLEAVWNKYKNMPSHRLWLLEAIPATGTTAALRFIKEKFQAEDLSVAEAVRTLVAAVHMVKANPESIKLFETLTEDNKINANPVLREIVFLGYGTMISKYSAEAAACNVAMKILSPKLDRLSLRYSKAVYGEAYSSSLMLGAAATAFYINDAATFLPRSVVAKTRAFFAGAAADVLEIGVRTDGLQETLLKNPSILESTDRITKMKRVIKALSQWRSLPNNKALASFYFKLFGQEIAFANIDKPMVERAIELASGPSVQAYGLKALKTLLLSGVNFHYAMPVLFTEVRRVLPTATGLPVELSLYSAAVAAAAVEIKPTLSPRLPEDFPLSRLLETEIKLETEIRPSYTMETYALMGVNTPVFQAFMVSRAKFNSTVPAKISARLDIKEGDFKIEALPVSTPENITAGSFETYAVTRNIEEPTAEKITPILPYKAFPSISSQIVSSEDSSSDEVMAAVAAATAAVAAAAEAAAEAAVVAAAAARAAAEAVVEAAAEAAAESQKANSHRFRKSHKNQTLSSEERSRSRSSDSSFEAIYSKNEFLDERDVAVVVSVRAVKTNKKDLGYQVVVYVDKPNARLQIILYPLSGSNWKLCADGVLLSKHKVSAKLAWGEECKEYSTMITGETGLVSSSPAARLRMTWEKLPSYVKRYGEKAYDYMPTKMLADLIKEKRANSTRQLSFTVVAESEKSIELIAKTPRRTSYNMTLHLPITLPLQELKTLTPFEEVIDKVHYVFAKAVADIDLYPKEEEVHVKVNGMAIPLTSLPYQHPTDSSRDLSNIFDESVDVRESTEAHLACSCSPQCS